VRSFKIKKDVGKKNASHHKRFWDFCFFCARQGTISILSMGTSLLPLASSSGHSWKFLLVFCKE
jgi:hypothetical protein